MSTTPQLQIAVTRERRRFAPGMIVLDPGAPLDGRNPTVWTVSKVTARGTTLQADYGAEQAIATLRGGDAALVPEDWHVIPHDAVVTAALAADLVDLALGDDGPEEGEAAGVSMDPDAVEERVRATEREALARRRAEVAP